jgi:hypothetical protein
VSLDKAALLAKRGVGGETVEIPGVGEVKVRGLTRAEVLSIQKLQGKSGVDEAEMERKLVALAMVEPELTEEEVGQWQANSPAGELVPIADAIATLSGLQVKQVKEEMRSFQ